CLSDWSSDVCTSDLAAPGRSADMDRRAPRGVVLGLAQHLVGERGGVPLAEEDVLGQVLQRVALDPAEVDVRPLAGGVAQPQQERSEERRVGEAWRGR